jgi:hypothetical protein
MATLRFAGRPVPSLLGLHQRVNTNLVTPRCCVLQLNYTMLGTEAAADVFQVEIPQGFRLLPHLSIVTSDGAATALVMKIGDTDPAGADDDRYGAALAVGAAGVYSLNANTKGVAATALYTTTADCLLTVTLTTVTTPVAGKKLEFQLFYTGA